MTIGELHQKDIKSLTQMALDLEIEDVSGLRKQDLIFRILQSQVDEDGMLGVEGVLEILPEGFGFLRSRIYNYLPGRDDIFVAPQLVYDYAIRNGDTVEGEARMPRDRENYFSL
ncbi:MAG: Rho termination factor N-terminal domain-containing protein, partial [Bryobacterales bacterium]|nr:Rho termination factor N-terminal domain-containing protein [Bryobacterales bacterium]